MILGRYVAVSGRVDIAYNTALRMDASFAGLRLSPFSSALAKLVLKGVLN